MLKHQGYHIHILQLTTTAKFHSVAIYFQVTGHFETSAPNDPKVTWGHLVHLYFLSTLSLKFHSVHPMISHFQNIGNFSFSHWPE